MGGKGLVVHLKDRGPENDCMVKKCVKYYEEKEQGARREYNGRP